METENQHKLQRIHYAHTICYYIHTLYYKNENRTEQNRKVYNYI